MRLIFIVTALFVISCNSEQSDSTATINTENQPADSILISERIDGPANIRDTINGKLLFTLNDNVPVSATAPQNKWLKVGVFADLTQEQANSLSILKGSKIFAEGKEVGQAAENIRLISAFKNNGDLKGELLGYSALSNIKSNTIPENAFAAIVNDNSPALTITSFKRFLKDYQFDDYDGLLPGFRGYEIDESWVDDPSPLLRLWLLFKDDRLYGVFHSRLLNLNGAKTTKVKRGFYCSSFHDDGNINKGIIDAFNSFIGQVD